MVNTLKMELGHRLISHNLIYYKSEKINSKIRKSERIKNILPFLWLTLFHEFLQDELVSQWHKHMHSCYHNL